MSDRLPAHVEATALLRRVEAGGGFGTILKKGDPDRGALVLMLASRGAPDGNYRWQQVGPVAGADAATLADWSQKRVRFDEDLWLIELDIAEPERFIVETIAEG